RRDTPCREFHSRSGGGGEAFRRAAPARFRLMRDGGVSKSVKIVKTIPGGRGTLRSAGRGSGVVSEHCVTSTSRPFEERLREARCAKSPCAHRCGREPGL